MTQDEWGLRTVEWAKFTHKGTGKLVNIIINIIIKILITIIININIIIITNILIIIIIIIMMMMMKVDHFNTHLCVCNGDQLLASAKTIADTIAANRRSLLSSSSSSWSSLVSSRHVIITRWSIDSL